jgi:hypothetical protein
VKTWQMLSEPLARCICLVWPASKPRGHTVDKSEAQAEYIDAFKALTRSVHRHFDGSTGFWGDTIHDQERHLAESARDVLGGVARVRQALDDLDDYQTPLGVLRALDELSSAIHKQIQRLCYEFVLGPDGPGEITRRIEALYESAFVPWHRYALALYLMPEASLTPHEDAIPNGARKLGLAPAELPKGITPDEVLGKSLEYSKAWFDARVLGPEYPASNAAEANTIGKLSDYFRNYRDNRLAYEFPKIDPAQVSATQASPEALTLPLLYGKSDLEVLTDQLLEIRSFLDPKRNPPVPPPPPLTNGQGDESPVVTPLPKIVYTRANANPLVAKHLEQHPLDDSNDIAKATGVPANTVRNTDAWRNRDKTTSGLQRERVHITETMLQVIPGRSDNPADRLILNEQQEILESRDRPRIAAYLRGEMSDRKRAEFDAMSPDDQNDRITTWMTGIMPE